MMDYADNAVVNDPMFGEPLVGRVAIATHKTAEMMAMRDVNIDVTDRWMNGDQLVATWELTATHQGPYYNYPPTGKRISISGATAVTRGEDGKIVQETLYYDAEKMRKQLAGEFDAETDADQAEAEAEAGQADAATEQ